MSQNTEQQTEQTPSLFEQIALNTLSNLDDNQKNDLLEEAKTLLEGLNQKDWDATQINFLKSIISKIEDQIDTNTTQEILPTTQEINTTNQNNEVQSSLSTVNNKYLQFGGELTTNILNWNSNYSVNSFSYRWENYDIWVRHQIGSIAIKVDKNGDVNVWEHDLDRQNNDRFTMGILFEITDWTNTLPQDESPVLNITLGATESMDIDRDETIDVIDNKSSWNLLRNAGLNMVSIDKFYIDWFSDQNFEPWKLYDFDFWTILINSDWNFQMTVKNNDTFPKITYSVKKQIDNSSELSNLNFNIVTTIDKSTEQGIEPSNLFYLGLSQSASQLLQEKIDKFESEWVLDLQDMDMTDEMLSSILSYIDKLWKSDKVKSLILDKNKLNSLPPEIWNLNNLESLIWNDNFSIETIPEEIWQLKKLWTLSLNNNRIETIPREIWQLKSLWTLSLNNNRIETIPREIWQLKSLQGFDLSDNEITTLPSEIWNLNNLWNLDLQNNKISSLPEEIWQLGSLTVLTLNNNELNWIPSEIWDLDSLQILNLSNNHLNDLPSTIWDLENLKELDLSKNSLLHDDLYPLCDSRSRLKNLTSLNLSWNGLSTMPDSIKILESLQNLDLSNNWLVSLWWSVIRESWLSNLVNLQTLLLNNNEISSIPLDIVNLVKLQKLDLRNNDITDVSHLGVIANLSRIKKFKI